MRSAFTIGLVLTALSLPATARADGPPPRTSSLGWVRLAGAEACIGGRALAEAVEQHLGRQVFVAPTRADVAVEGRIEPAGPSGGWRATITLSDGGGTREFRSDDADCRALDGTLVLALTLMIEPEPVTEAVAPPRPPPPAPPSPAPLPPLAPPPRCEPPPPPPRSWDAGAQAGFAVGVGMLPRAGAGVAMRVHVVPPRGPAFELGGTVWIAQGAQASGPGASFDLAYGSGSICPLALTASRTVFFACGGVQVGALRVAAVGFDHDFKAEQLVVDVTAEAHARRRLVGPLFAAVGLGFLVVTVRDQFFDYDALKARHDLFRMAPVAGTVEAGLGLALP